MDNKEMVQKLKKELVKYFIMEKDVTTTNPIVSLSFYTNENMVTVKFEEANSNSIIFSGLEMTIALADTVMEDLGFTKIKSPYTGYGKRGVYIYRMD